MVIWAAVRWMDGIWVPEQDLFASRRQRAVNRGAFRHAVVPMIADATAELPSHTQERACAATAELERFDEASRGWGIPFASVLLRSESASSSQIERLTASARRISLATLGDTRSGNAVGVARNVEAMNTAIALADRLDADAILTMHRALAG